MPENPWPGKGFLVTLWIVANYELKIHLPISSKNKDLGDAGPDFTKALVLFHNEHMCFSSIFSYNRGG
jgi:hypothetical protein